MTAERGGTGRRRISGAKRSASLALRLDPRLKEALDAAAERAGLTLSLEAARRLERSLADESDTAFNDPATRGLCALLVLLADSVTAITDRSWRTDAFSFEELVGGIRVLIDGLPHLLGLYPRRPSGASVPPRVKQFYTSPRQIPPTGEIGAALARGLLDILPLHAGPPVATEGRSFSRGFLALPAIYHDLALARDQQRGRRHRRR